MGTTMIEWTVETIQSKEEGLNMCRKVQTSKTAQRSQASTEQWSTQDNTLIECGNASRHGIMEIVMP